MKGGEAARKRNRCPFGMISGNISEDKPLLTRVTRHGKKFPFIFIYPLNSSTTSEYSILASPGHFAVGSSSLMRLW